MIELHFWPTSNGQKVAIFLEEAGIPYEAYAVNIGKGDQFKPDFLKLSPNGKIPAILDRSPADGGAPISVFESAAILMYLAEKTGKFLSKDLRTRVRTTEWLFWQMGGLGPNAGQANHFGRAAPEKIPYAIDRFVKETNRLYGRARRPARQVRVHRRRILHRGHVLLSVGGEPRMAPGESGRIPQREALVRDDQGAPGCQGRL